MILQYFKRALIFLILVYAGCSNVKQDFVVVKNNSEVDLTQFDSVKHYLNGFWLLKDKKSPEGANIFLRLDFNQSDSSSVWERIEYKKNLWTHIEMYSTCEPIVTLVEQNDTIKLRFTTMTGSRITKIDYLSKTKLIINDITFLKHNGVELSQ